MANTFTCLSYHVVFTTKHREPWLRPEIEERVWAYLGGIARENGLKPLLIGGVDDHILSGCRGFSWQDGYGAFTVSKSLHSGVREYIRGQREHHRIKTFQEEYRALLDRHEIKYEEKYLWD